jgi:hypothetical protein
MSPASLVSEARGARFVEPTGASNNDQVVRDSGLPSGSLRPPPAHCMNSAQAAGPSTQVSAPGDMVMQ